MPRKISHIAVGVIYHPPGAPSGPMTQHIINNIDHIVSLHPHAGIILVGDFIALNDKTLRSYPLKQIVHQPTRGHATLDKIYTNVAEWYEAPVTAPNIASSDHCSILLLQSYCKPAPDDECQLLYRRHVSTNGKNLLACALNNFDWSVLEYISDIDMKVEYFNSSIITLLNIFLPVQAIKRRLSDKPWITDRFRQLIRRRQCAWSSGNRSAYNRLRNQINRLSKQLRTEFYQKRIHRLRTCNPHQWWQKTKQLLGQHTKSELQSLMNNVAGGDAQLLAELINNSLGQVSRDLHALAPMRPTDVTETDLPSDFHITPYEVADALSHVSIYKSSGPDGIPNWLLRDFAYIIAEPVCNIVNASIINGVVPSLWKQADVVPIPKLHPATSITSDLRPISLTPTLSKVLEKLVGRRMLPKILDKFDQRQFGALKGRSTTHALAAITHQWHQALDNRQSSRTLFVDYSKAFDHVDHQTVLSKMTALGLDHWAIQWMHSFLSNRQQRVKVGSALSTWTTLTGGMPQGTWFGPYVFIILIDDLQTTMDTYKFVDDVTIIEVVDQPTETQMQLAADQLAKWSHQNLMNINIKKSKEMLFGAMKTSPPPLITFGTATIDRVTSFKLLGVVVTDTLSWEDHVTMICAKANKRLYSLKLLKRSGVTTTDLAQYYMSVIRPVLEYACPIWQSSLTAEQRDSLENIQRRALRIITNSCDYELQCVILDIEPFYVRTDNLTRSFFNKVQCESDCIHNLLPTERSNIFLSKLRCVNVLPYINCRTNRFYKSFVPHSLRNYQ